jgi:hypothetical protein
MKILTFSTSSSDNKIGVVVFSRISTLPFPGNELPLVICADANLFPRPIGDLVEDDADELAVEELEEEGGEEGENKFENFEEEDKVEGDEE